MKNRVLNLMILAIFGTQISHIEAAGLVAIPATGFGTTAYTLCNTTGNFGSVSCVAGVPANNTCAVSPMNEVTSPVSGYTLIASANRNAVINGIGVGVVSDRVWRNQAKTSCIFGLKYTPSLVDWDPNSPGNQYLEINDIARGGFSGAGTVNAGYFTQVANASTVYRIGRTFTSVQHRALAYDNATNRALDGINYLDLPTANSITAAYSGVNSPIDATTTASTTSATQDAAVNANWVDFTLETGYQDDDSSSCSVSPVLYIEAPCDSSAPSGWVKSGAIRLRQTGQENEVLIEILVDGYAPPGATVP